ncbi:App1 family protein [Methylobacterium sp. WSM2598]|uniref:App1 family protein n=1 Tax=Methylobacterium sp. WSM2598 TaxID=398261 RepID=UPI000366676C|nr:phosphatase domain-containing protein [Methylobacterium sp. WSM2598]
MTGARAGRLRRAAGWILGLAARPVRRAQGRRGVAVEVYRGYGSAQEIFLIGRAFRQSEAERAADPDDLRAQLRDIGRRIRRRRLPGLAVEARFGGSAARAVTDRDGYFRIHLCPRPPGPGEGAWHPVSIRLASDPPVEARGEVFIPPPRCRFVVISDIDDTVMHTGVANKLKMLWRLFVADATRRVAFPGVAALYRALHAGAGGAEQNPMLYVSRAPWGIYDMLSEFFRLHDIPVGPVLFLREWGLSWRHPLPRRAEDHKAELIRRMLALYRDLPFVLIGDSGQHDPEVYAGIVHAHPGRVLAVYIRNVSRAPERAAEIARLAREVAAAGSSLVLAADSRAIAAHAAGLGLIAAPAVEAVASEKAAAEGATRPRRPRRITRPTPEATATAASGEAVEAALGGTSPEPPTVIVEPAGRREAGDGAQGPAER